MAEQAQSGGGFIKAFLPGLAIGIVVGALAWAFLGPMVSNPPEPMPVNRTAAPGSVPSMPAGRDERAAQPPETPHDDRSAPDGRAPTGEQAPPTAPDGTAKPATTPAEKPAEPAPGAPK